MNRFSGIFSFLLVSFVLAGQKSDTIFLFNPSFEDKPQCCKPPVGWSDCGFPEETPPDVQPAGGFQVTKPAIDGYTYMGMVTRDNDTWESVQQRLSKPVEAGTCYAFSVYLCRSAVYVSGTRNNLYGELSFTSPIKLRIWGSNGYCNKRELLSESPLISNTDWIRYDFKFEPDQTHHYIILEAFYKTPTLFPYNGNLLVDNASPIYEIPCRDDIVQLSSVEDGKTNPATNRKSLEKPGSDSRQSNSKKSEEKIPERILALDRNKLKKGSIITIERLYFEADSSSIPADCFGVMDEVYQFLLQNEDIIIEIGGHTNGIPRHEYCDKLSLERAKSVANFISEKGIHKRRLFYRGYGKRKPIADDSTPEGKRKNQRVEIRILHMKE
jgi:outer membrane protein OmpA-like peptidoglycan-associated protein